MHDNRTVTLLEVQELVTNPEKVMRGLLRQRNAGANSRMNKQEITAGKTVLKSTEKEAMRCGENLAQTPMDTELRRIQIGIR
ncbi:putative protein OS=Afipia felis OX=1035 GN=NCTC12722_02261 PE=4 SV=1 [Afipia felis]